MLKAYDRRASGDCGTSGCSSNASYRVNICWAGKGKQFVDQVTLTLKFDLLSKNFNLGHSSLTRRGRAFIFHMYILCDNTFPWIHF